MEGEGEGENMREVEEEEWGRWKGMEKEDGEFEGRRKERDGEFEGRRKKGVIG